MNPTTLYMDTDNPKRNRLFWIFQSGLSLLWIVQGAVGISQPPDELPWFPWIQLLGGSFIVVSLVGFLILLKKDGRPRIVLDAEGLEIKSKLRGRAKRIPWKSISNISFSTHELEINTEGGQGPFSVETCRAPRFAHAFFSACLSIGRCLYPFTRRRRGSMSRSAVATHRCL